MPRRVALVTGAGRRIGRAIALDLARHGYDVAIHCNRSGAEAEAVAAEIRAGNSQAIVVEADLADLSAVARIVPEVTAVLGAPTLLVNNASVFLDDTPETLTPEQWQHQMTVNLAAPVFLARDFAAAADAADDPLVVNLLDQRVLRPTPLNFSYTLTKSALWNATRTLAQALAPKVRVVGIGPGPALANPFMAPGELEAEIAAIPLKRGPDLAEFGRAVRFLVEAHSVTGQMLALDGGQHLGWETPDILGIAGK